MVVEKIGDFVFWGDVLSETKFKPWWETMRAYAVVGLYVIAFVIIYTLNPAKSIICLPTENATADFKTIGDDEIKQRCAGHIHWFLRNFGYIALGACLLIHVLYSWWLFVPRVKFTFKSLRKYDDKCDELGDLMDDIVQLQRRGSKASKEDLEERKKLEKSVKQVLKEINEFSPSMWISVPMVYVIRNLIALIGISASLYLLYTLKTFSEDPFTCAVASVTVQCSYDLLDKLEPFVICGMILLAVVGIITFLSIVLTVVCRRTATSFLDPLKRKHDYSFALNFGNHSLPISQNADLLLKNLPSVLGAVESAALPTGQVQQILDQVQDLQEDLQFQSDDEILGDQNDVPADTVPLIKK